MGGRQSAAEKVHQWRSGASPKGPEGAVLGEFYLILVIESQNVMILKLVFIHSKLLETVTTK